ncbi:MAG: Na/Pi cotransporter family protein [Succinivibrio sp.]|nr:Na/Pi cotransporter family protein [Succinivibrio sp.]
MHFILGLLSAVALLAYSVSVTKNSVLRVCGASLGSILNRALNSRFKSVLTGLGTTMLVQSSTATSLLVSSFLSKGILSLGTALAIMLGADLGTAVMARLLTYDLSLLCPLLLTVGTACYLMGSDRPKLRNGGGIILGLGLILLALSLIVSATKPVLSSDLTALLLRSLTDQITFSVLLGVMLAVICYSSLAAVLLTSLLSTSGSIEPESALALVIGSNLGSCLLEIMGALRQGLAARRVMLGNTLFKCVISVVCLPLLPFIVRLQEQTLSLGEFVIWFHVGFNTLVCVAMLPLVEQCSKLLYILLPEQETLPDPNKPKHLDRNAYMDPDLALANATRELLSLGDFLQQMLGNLGSVVMVQGTHSTANRDLKTRIRNISAEVSDYLSGINCDSGAQRKRMRLCLLASVNLSECSQLVNQIDKRLDSINQNLPTAFSTEDRNEVLEISRGCARTLELALTAFFTNGKEQRQHYFAGRQEFLQQLNRFSDTHFSHKVLKPGPDFRFNMAMLEVMEHFRQLSVIFDPLFSKTAEYEKAES